MKIILDAMGGDNAPGEIVKGAVLAASEYGINTVLVGRENVILEHLSKIPEYAKIKDKIEIQNADDIIEMGEDPFSIMRAKKESSAAVAMRLLKDGSGDAFVGAGSTGAMVIGASMIVRTIPKIRRGAIATVLPFEKPLLLIDSGANISVTPEYLEQFAAMGSVYMNKIFGIEKPRIGLLNNGAEVLVETHKLLKGSDLNFVGNVEARDITFGVCDVLVCDGFSGNVVLKYSEGMAKFFSKKLKGLFLANVFTKISALIVKKQIAELKKSFDASEYGGAPILGISKPVIKAHGSSDAQAIKNALRQAKAFVETGVIDDICEYTNKRYQKNEAVINE